MATTFDGINLIITLTAGGSVHTVDVEADLYSDWKEWYKNSANMGYPPAFRVVGGDNLTGGIDAGAYFFLRNDLGWRIRPAEEHSTITVTGNLIAQDSAKDIIVPTVGNYNVFVNGLQPITQNVDGILEQQQNTAYEGAVTIDTISGVSGTAYPVGTRTTPVNNLPDALTIASALGIEQINLHGTITLNQSFAHWVISGISATGNDVVNLNGQSVDAARFDNVLLQGSGTGTVEARHCNLNNVSGLTGHFTQCGFQSNYTAGAGNSVFTYCHSEIAGVGKPVLDVNGSLSDISIRAYTGGIDIQNMTNAGSNITIDLLSGSVLLNANSTAGNVVIRGAGELTDNSTLTVTRTGLVDARELTLARKLLANRQYTNPVTGQLEVYNDADTAVEYTAPIYEDDGVLAWDGTGAIVRRDKFT